MNSMYKDVAKFHREVLGVGSLQIPHIGTDEFIHERFKFMLEELEEYHNAAIREDIVGATDGLLDLIYVALGTLYYMDIPVQECWNAVQQANMKKVRGTTKRGNKVDAMKPEGWRGPEGLIAAAIERETNGTTD